MVGLFISLEILWIVAEMAPAIAIRMSHHNYASLELIVQKM